MLKHPVGQQNALLANCFNQTLQFLCSKCGNNSSRMFLGHICIICVTLLQVFGAPDLSQALARVNEAKARALANRARFRSNSARITSHLRNPPNRSKREPDLNTPPYPPPPPPYEEDELVPIHICSAEENDYSREAEEDLDEFVPVPNPELEARASDPHHHHIHHILHRPIQHLGPLEPGFNSAHNFINHNLNLNLNQQTHRTDLGHNPHFSRFDGIPHQQGVLNFQNRPLLDPRIKNENIQVGEADPTFKKKKKHQVVYPGYGYAQQYRDAEETVGSPHLKKDKEPEIIVVPIYNQRPYYSQAYGGGYREAEDPKSEQVKPDEPKNDETVGSPHLKKDKKEEIIVIPIYNQQKPYYSQPYGEEYREAENVEEDSKTEEVKPDEPKNEDAAVGSPHLKEKMEKEPEIIVVPIYNQRPYYSQAYGGEYREAENVEDRVETEDLPKNDEFLGSPHLDKLKDKEREIIVVPIYSQEPYYSQAYGQGYRAADEISVNPDEPRLDDETVGSPTLKKFKEKKQIIVVPIYNQNSYYHQGYGGYREAEDAMTAAPEAEADQIEETVGSPTFKKKHKQQIVYVPVYNQGYHYQGNNYHQGHHYQNNNYGRYRAVEETPNFQPTEERERENEDSTLTSNFLFNIPQNRRFSNQFKRSLDDLDAILGEERQIVDDLGTKSHHDEDLQFITDLSNQTLSDLEEKRKNITKRSLPLTRLMTDPNVKLDVPQTIENFGTAAKRSFEDERAPMYHFKNMLGSSRNAFLAAMKIPPHNMVIPSDYEIMKTSHMVGNSRRDFDEDPFSDTFKKVGNMVRQSVRSGQETIAHVGDAAHSARNILHTARHSAPRLIQIPAIQDTRRKRPNKAILITPRLFDLAQETSARNAEELKPNLVKLGHLMDAVGVSKPGTRKLDLQQIIFEPHHGIRESKIDERVLEMYSKLHDDETMSNALNTLEDAKISVGAKNLRDFLVKMKGELGGLVQSKPPKKRTRLEKKKQETKEMGKFIENLFDGKHEAKKGAAPKNEIVGDGLNLPPELLHPFMGRATDKDLKGFFRDNGDEDELKKIGKQDLGHVLGAVNPMMFERIYNETVRMKNTEAQNPEDLFRESRFEEEPAPDVGTSMVMTEPLLKPFMGQAPKQQVLDLLETYNGDEISESDDE